MHKLISYLNLSEKHWAIYELFKLIFIIIMIAHFFTCGFHLINEIERMNGSEDTWLSTFNLDGKELFPRY